MKDINKILTNKDLLPMIKYIYDNVVKFTTTDIDKKIKDVNGNKYNKENTIIKNKIFEEISNAYGLSKNTILYSKKRGDVKQAKAMAFILFYKYLNITQKEIAQIFRIKRQSINRRILSFDKNKDLSLDKFFNDIFIKKFEIINNKIKHLVK